MPNLPARCGDVHPHPGPLRAVVIHLVFVCRCVCFSLSLSLCVCVCLHVVYVHVLACEDVCSITILGNTGFCCVGVDWAVALTPLDSAPSPQMSECQRHKLQSEPVIQ